MPQAYDNSTPFSCIVVYTSCTNTGLLLLEKFTNHIDPSLYYGAASLLVAESDSYYNPRFPSRQMCYREIFYILMPNCFLYSIFKFYFLSQNQSIQLILFLKPYLREYRPVFLSFLHYCFCRTITYSVKFVLLFEINFAMPSVTRLKLCPNIFIADPSFSIAVTVCRASKLNSYHKNQHYACNTVDVCCKML